MAELPADLTHLSLDGTGLNNLSLGAPGLLFLSLKGCTSLSQLSLTMPLLKRLDLTGCVGMKTEVLQALMPSLSQFEGLSLQQCSLADSFTGEELCISYPSFKNYDLNYPPYNSPYSRCKIPSKFKNYSFRNPLLEAITSLLVGPTFTTVDLRSNKIGAEGAKALAEALKTNASLTTVNLEGNEVGDEGAKALAEALKTNASLTTVDLWGNKIGDEGAKALSEIEEALKRNRKD